MGDRMTDIAGSSSGNPPPFLQLKKLQYRFRHHMRQEMELESVHFGRNGIKLAKDKF